MLGLSLSKLVVLAILVALIWYGFKFVNRVEEVRQAVRRREAGRRRPVIEAEDMVKCATCGAYVAGRGAGPCNRPGCPWGR